MTKAIMRIWKFFRLVVSSAFIPPGVFSFPNFSDSVTHDLLHISLQISQKEAAIRPTSSTLYPQV